MFKYTVMALLATIIAAGATQTIATLDSHTPPAPLTQPLQLAEAAGAAAIAKAADGHFWAEGNVDGHVVRFLVDTGATAVALTQADAARMGLDPAKLVYSYSVVTADGKARAAPVMIKTLAIAGAEVRDVQAFVIEKGLATSLLGMSYLGRLSRIEATPTSLILRP